MTDKEKDLIERLMQGDMEANDVLMPNARPEDRAMFEDAIKKYNDGEDRQFKLFLVDDSPTLEQYRRVAKSYFKNRNGNPLILGSINPAKEHWVTKYLKDKDNERL